MRNAVTNPPYVRLNSYYRGGSSFEPLESRRYLSGALVSSFGTNGQIIGDSIVGYTTADTLIPFGKGGAFILKPDGDLVRLLSNGAVDTRFANGSLDADIGGPSDLAAAPDGSVYVFASDAAGQTIQHYLKTGRLDRSFGDDGHLDVASFAGIGAHGGGFASTVVAPDDSIYGVVSIGGTDPDDTYRLYHIPDDGDASKITSTEIGTSGSETSDFRQVLLGSTGNVFVLNDGVTAYDKNLNPIADFGADGTALAGQDVSQAALDSSGRLIVIELDQTAADTPHLVRLLADGKIDTTFGTAGSVTLPEDAAGEVYSTGNELVVEPDGSCIVATPIENPANVNETLKVGLRAYDSNGALKPDVFGQPSNGMISSTLGRLIGSSLGIIPASNGDIYLSTVLKHTLLDGTTTDSNFFEELTGT